jgi:glycosyltransferase involved in cell wall biosynthesis
MVKVCHIISGDLWAGAEVMAYNLLKSLTKYKDLELSAILLNEGRLAEEIRRLNIPVEVIDESKMSFFQIFLAIRKVLNRWGPDVIHSHRYKENILAYLVSKTKKGIKLIATQHGMPEIYGGNITLKHRLISKLNFFMLPRCFQNIVVVSKDIQKAFVNQYRFPEDKVIVIRNGIEISENIPMRKEKNTFVIGSSGRLFPVKDYSLMVEVAREILKKTNGIRFELAGDGPERPKIEDLIKKNGLDGTFLLRGFVSDTTPFYSGLDLYINTSVHEGIPMSVLEAMSYGIPIIAPNVGGLTEIIENGIQGFLVEGRDAEDFAERCITLIENEPLRKQMGSAAREKIMKKFSLENMVQQYYHLYCSIYKKEIGGRRNRGTLPI